MTTELFLKWLDHFLKHAPDERPLLLIMDQHETHYHHQVIDVCRAIQIEILLLPPHRTHILQPLDISIFNPLKAIFTQLATRMELVRGDMVSKKQFSSPETCPRKGHHCRQLSHSEQKGKSGSKETTAMFNAANCNHSVLSCVK